MEESLKNVLANTFAMYLKAYGFHWNVEGPDFVQLHDFFGTLYLELFGAIDPIAEHIRAIDQYAPNSMARMIALADIKEVSNIPTAQAMIKQLESDNKIVMASLMKAYQAAEKEKELGLANFLQDRIDIHAKHGWMLRSISK